MLLAGLRKARERAKMVTCLATLRGMAGASLTYAAEDRTEQSIPVHGLFGTPAHWGIGAYEWGGRSGQGEPLSGK